MLGQGVYKIPYFCVKSNIGQIGTSFKAGLKEHIADTVHNWKLKNILIRKMTTNLANLANPLFIVLIINPTF